MKLILPNGKEIDLKTDISLEEKQKVVDGILEEWKEYFEQTFQLYKTKICLEVLSNYLCNHKEEDQKNKEDKFILSPDKIKSMERGNKRTSNFSNLSYEEQASIGISSSNDEE
jgi:hypothetical protein